MIQFHLSVEEIQRNVRDRLTVSPHIIAALLCRDQIAPNAADKSKTLKQVKTRAKVIEVKDKVREAARGLRIHLVTAKLVNGRCKGCGNFIT